MPQLDVSTYSSQIFWLMACFFGLFLAVRFLILPRMQSILDARWERRENNQKRAIELTEEVMQLLEKTNKNIGKAKEEAKEIILKMEASLHQDQEKKLLDLQKKLNKMVKDAELKIEEKKQEIDKEIPQIVVQLSESILKDCFLINATPSELAKGLEERPHV